MTTASRTGIAVVLATAAALTIAAAPEPVTAAPPGERPHASAPGAKPQPGQRPTLHGTEDQRGSNRARATTQMLAATPETPLEACPDDASWLCGTVAVPFDRARPGGRQQTIAFAVLPHADPTATATDALVMSDGGPGVANIANKGFLQFLAGDLTEERDLVVVDHRGTGQSGAIDCARLQRIIGDFFRPADSILREIGRCGRQLGDGADRYGSGDVAKDLDAVRSALGHEQISMYGLSYGGVFVTAYAARFPDRLRAAVIDSGTPVTDPRHSWTWGQDIPRATAVGAALDCRRAPACTAAQPRAASALARLAAAVRKDPVRGTVEISGVGPQRVVVDERALIALAAADWRNVAELAAAAQALDRGDKVPLLRLSGENRRFSDAGEPADPETDSAGNNVAVFCNDVDPVWGRTDPVGVRKAKYERELRTLARRAAFAPYSARGWTEYFLSAYCTYWPAPDRFTPAIRTGATVTDVPVLILSGDRDTQVPTRTSAENLRAFPDATFLRVAGAAHAAAGWSECGGTAFHDFVRTLSPPAAETCAEPAWVMAAASRFPERAAGAVPADPRAGDDSTPLRRRVVTAVVHTVRDAWLRGFRDPASVGPFAGLRGGGGTFDFDDWPTNVVDLQASRYVADVAVTGESVFQSEENTVTFTVQVDGPGALDGTLTGAGLFGYGAPYADFEVTGSLGGSAVDASVPAN